MSSPGTEPRDRLATWLQGMLRARSWHQSDLANRMQVNRSMVSKWARGERIPDPPHCRSIAEAFAVPLNEVLVLAGHVPVSLRDEPDHPVRQRLHELVDVIDPDILAHHLALLERIHALTNGTHHDG